MGAQSVRFLSVMYIVHIATYADQIADHVTTYADRITDHITTYADQTI